MKSLLRSQSFGRQKKGSKGGYLKLNTKSNYGGNYSTNSHTTRNNTRPNSYNTTRINNKRTTNASNNRPIARSNSPSLIVFSAPNVKDMNRILATFNGSLAKPLPSVPPQSKLPLPLNFVKLR